MVELRGTWISGTIFKRTLEATQNDYGNVLHLQFQNRMGSGISLTTSGAVLLSTRRSEDTQNLISGQTCTSSVAAIGLYTYTIQSGDLANTGKHRLQASYRTATEETTAEGLTINILQDYTPR